MPSSAGRAQSQGKEKLQEAKPALALALCLPPLGIWLSMGFGFRQTSAEFQPHRCQVLEDSFNLSKLG